MAETTTKTAPKKAATKTGTVSALPAEKKPADVKTPVAAKPAAKKPAAKTPAPAKPEEKKPAAAKPASAKKLPAKPAARSSGKAMVVSDAQRYRMVAEAAYYRAESNQFKSDSVRDWIEAEADIAALLNGSK